MGRLSFALLRVTVGLGGRGDWGDESFGLSVDWSSGEGGSGVIWSDMFASWGSVGCFASGDGDFGEIGPVFGFSVLGAEEVGMIIFDVDGDAGGGFCWMGFGCVGLIGLVIVR